MARVFTYQFERRVGTFLAVSRIRMEIQYLVRSLSVAGV